MAGQTSTLDGAAGAPTPAGRLRSAFFGTPADLLLHVSLLIALLVFVLSIPYFTRGSADEFKESLFQHAYVLVWMLVVTALGRTLGLRTLAAFFFVGVFTAMIIVLTIDFPLAEALGVGAPIFNSLLAPLVEEAVKAAPVVILFVFLVRRGWQPSVTDGLLLGFVVGSGFAIHEDAMYERLYGSGTDGELGFILPTLGEQTTITRQSVFGFYHSGWTSLIGLGLGFGFLLRRRLRLAFLIPIVAFAIVVIDHGVGNHIIEEGDTGLLGILWTLNLEGRLPIYLLLIGIPAAIIFELVVERGGRRADPLFPALPVGKVLAGFRPSLDGLLRIQAARHYWRSKRAYHYQIWAAAEDASATRAQAWRVARYADELGLAVPDVATEAAQ